MKPLQLSAGHWVNVDLITRIVSDRGGWYVYVGLRESPVMLTAAEGQVLAAFLGLEVDAATKS